MQTVKIEMNWEASMRLLLVILENGNDVGKASARKECLRCAKALDNCITKLEEKSK